MPITHIFPYMNGTEYLGNDRFLHDIVSTALAGKKNRRKDASLDRGAKEYGSNHRNEWPHRNSGEMALFLCMEDRKAGREPDFTSNMKLAMGHIMVDQIPAGMKKKLQLISLLAKM